MSEAKSHRGHRERHGGGYRENQQQQQRTRPSSNTRPSDQSQYSRRNQSSQSQHGRRTTSEEVHGSACTHICSRRGIVLMCAFLTNMLVLFCVVAAYVTLSGMSAMKFGGGGFADVVLPFEGAELQKVRDLDMQFTQMRAPGIYGGLAFSVTFGVISLFFVFSGNKPAHVLSRKLLVGQFLFQLIGAVAYVTAVGLYLHFVIKVNSTEVCMLRERLYARNGQTWMNCNVSGADAAVALFGIITAILYAVGTFLTGRTIQYVNWYRKGRARYEAETPERPRNTQDTPLQSGVFV
ncbi:MARVEL domain-containing protein 3 [Neoarius graeffei]|uniref:MARVEL domain-containing protein 3 n=1 Tax=Neoarius graeffei TaxID=443677 RepID=UPI00298C0059|nr:MARVEL domain-containing protein 3 [Neoarius graeffei]XP_060772062.1 MARVEL domain-containing protein 3 [Neoarius graeffei]